MLSIQRIDNMFVPVVICDYCNQVIDDAIDGNFLWKVLEDGSIGETGKIYFTHKHCDQAFEDNNPETNFLWYSDELDNLPIYLMRSLNMNI
ncbi:MAG: hypothetical protein OHK0022_24200 [Roseiflexaceae bacterium]